MTDVEEVDYHSRLKHEFIRIYLDFFRINVAETARENGRSPPPLQIYDLYAAKGWCHCEELERLDQKNSIWKGSALIAADCIGEYPTSTRLFLNTFNPDSRKCGEQRAALETNLLEFYGKYPTLKSKTTIISKPVEDAIDEGQYCLNRNYPNVWILDPYDALPWTVIQKITDLRGSYRDKKGNRVERKPELIINLMSSILTRFSETNPENTTIALGMPEEEWMPLFHQYKYELGNAREAILKIYFERLKALYGKEPVFTLVRDVTNRAIVYAMMLCSSNKTGYYLMHVKGLPTLAQFKVEVWQSYAKKIVRRRKDAGQQFLI
ncbi:MAG: three-Cys-motif partner protein TcmP [Methanoregula sp.]|jgi:three-Cys-motif partner protein